MDENETYLQVAFAAETKCFNATKLICQGGEERVVGGGEKAEGSGERVGDGGEGVGGGGEGVRGGGGGSGEGVGGGGVLCSFCWRCRERVVRNFQMQSGVECDLD